ncbi:MAG: hypothetical protein ACR2LK_15775 [Solirubrobacteraceae bacterium]
MSMRFNLPRPATSISRLYAPPKYMDVLDVLREAPATTRVVGIAICRNSPGAPTTRSTALASGRLRSLEDAGAVERIQTELTGDQEAHRHEILWRLTPAGANATACLTRQSAPAP